MANNRVRIREKTNTESDPLGNLYTESNGDMYLCVKDVRNSSDRILICLRNGNYWSDNPFTGTEENFKRFTGTIEIETT